MQVNSYIEFTDPTKNCEFSKLRGLDLQELIVTIENFELTYREKLDLPDDISFGFELEYEKVYRSIVDKFLLKHFPTWNSKRDDSLLSGGEITSPILYNKVECWEELEKVCKFLKSKKADTFHYSGGHIHVTRDILKTVEEYKLFLKYYAVFEHVAFRYSYGEKLNGRKRQIKYAEPIAGLIYSERHIIEHAENISFIRSLFGGYKAINFNPDSKKTNELRLFNASSEEVVWQNNCNFSINTFLAAPRGKIDPELIDFKFTNELVTYERQPYMYNEVCLENALLFADMTFINNLDKVYFLRQYLKGFESSYGASETIKAKKFIKR